MKRIGEACKGAPKRAHLPVREQGRAAVPVANLAPGSLALSRRLWSAEDKVPTPEFSDPVFKRRCNVKSFNISSLSVILLGCTAALLLSPASKAQEGFDHFTGTSVQNVYEPVASKPAQPAVKQMPADLQAQKRQTGSASTLQLATKQGSSLPTKPQAKAAAKKRKPTAHELKKP